MTAPKAARTAVVINCWLFNDEIVEVTVPPNTPILICTYLLGIVMF